MKNKKENRMGWFTSHGKQKMKIYFMDFWK